MFQHLSHPGLWRARSTLQRLTLIGSLLTLGLLGSGTGTASASTLISTQACNTSPLSQPFLPWHDESQYELAPDGNLEGAMTGWTLTGAATRVAGGEPYEVDGSTGAYSLSLPAGSTAQTPASCVDAAYPTFRFFATNSTLGILLVQVVYKTLLGTTVLPVGAVALSSQWQPTPTALTASVALGLLSGGTTQMAIRFTALTGTSRIDDIYIDPRMH
jgi:hypothetical protein